MKRYSPRSLATVLALVALVIVAVGCESPVISNETAGQQDLIGPVRITTTFEGCDNGTPVNNENCPSSDYYQLLVGYRVPEAADAPTSFLSTAGPSATFHSSSSYTSELERLAAAPSGEKWAGYISDKLNLPATTTDPDRITVAPEFGMPSSAAGTPFTYRTVVGMRNDLSLTDATRPVVCDATQLIGTGSDSNSTDCVTDPSSLTTIAADQTTPALNDLSLAAGPAPTVHPGDTATVPFVATLAGPALSSGGFSLSTISPLAGAATAPGSPTLTPSPGANATSATLKVPVTAVPGDYPLTLTATSGNQSRQATGTVHVVALPGLTVTFTPRSLTVSKSGVVTLPISCPSTSVDPCNGTVTLNTAGKVVIAKKHKARRRALKLGAGNFALAPGASGIVKVKLSSTGRKALARTGRLAAKLSFVMTDRAGERSTTVKRVTLRGAKLRKKK